MILSLQREIPASFCERVIQLAGEDFKPAGVISADKMAKVKSDIGLVEQYGADKTYLNGDKVYFWPSHKNYEAVKSLVMPVLTSLVEKYCEASGYEIPDWQVDYFSVIRYEEGGFFKAHQDSVWQPNGQQRTITVIIYLNEDFDGGTLCFVDKNTNVTPTTGGVAIFPCGKDFIHASTPIMRGTKYALTLWPLVAREKEPSEPYIDREQLTKGNP